jgi:hypothetical protein
MTSRDPTGLTDVRNAIGGEMDKRWNAVRRIARRALAPATSKEAAPPMRPEVSPPLDIRGWLSDQLAYRVGGRDGRWLYPHLETAASRAVDRVGRLTGGSSSRLPVDLPPASLPACHLASATYLAGICADTAAEAHSAVAEGLLRRPGRGPSVRAVDRALLRGRSRSRVLAEHAITQAHAQATLDALRAAGIELVGSISEHRALPISDQFIDPETEVAEDHDHDVPELSCMSRDGRTFYWDRRLPLTAQIGDKTAFVPELLSDHETAELKMVRDLQAVFIMEHGREPDQAERVAIYERAHHRGGLVAEKAEADRQGIDWRKWNDWCGAKYEEIKSLPVTNPVPDPHVRPAPHDRGDYEETLDADDPYWRSSHSGKFVTKAHHAALDPDDEWEGPEEGSVGVETAEDDRVCQVCEDISDNGPYTIDEARDLIPSHPGCRCLLVPAD